MRPPPASHARKSTLQRSAMGLYKRTSASLSGVVDVKNIRPAAFGALCRAFLCPAALRRPTRLGLVNGGTIRPTCYSAQGQVRHTASCARPDLSAFSCPFNCRLFGGALQDVGNLHGAPHTTARGLDLAGGQLGGDGAHNWGCNSSHNEGKNQGIVSLNRPKGGSLGTVHQTH